MLAPTREALHHEFGCAAAIADGLKWCTNKGPQFTGHDAERLCQEWSIEHTFGLLAGPRDSSEGRAKNTTTAMRPRLVLTKDRASKPVHATPRASQRDSRWLPVNV